MGAAGKVGCIPRYKYFCPNEEIGGKKAKRTLG